MDKQTYILVPQAWLDGLLESTRKAESILDNMDEENPIFRIDIEMSMLIGYCKSAQTILNHNEKVVK